CAREAYGNYPYYFDYW
nr:immunoglobulin heavy chain junction region [Mus musculus]MBK4187656.1 immunoglobulin heavy chain junction region [Mus musculus]MBK4187657.1 immunoglobulin heavy chain junction region [Mus musculus]MBK4187658.1 immunoglobulin heavy chain junction region [Mus musculus]MBK4187660.1 immunoglobulin heavy chain junction region [Mus musculus]